MKCVICKTGTAYTGKATTTIEKNGSVLVFKEVGAEICDNCGEAYFSIDTTKKLLELAEDAVKKGTEIEVVKL